MSVFKRLFGRLRKAHYGFDSYWEVFLIYVDRVLRIANIHTEFYKRAHMCRLLHPDEHSYNIGRKGEIKMPLLEEETLRFFINFIFEDTFWSYLNHDDMYDEKIFDITDEFLCDGLYGLVNDKVNVTVRNGDIVIDAGSWIGDFAAYASVKGALVYAFEPTDENFRYLEQTAKLNKNITPVNKGVSDKNTSIPFFHHIGKNAANSFSDSFMNVRGIENFENASSSVETVTIDDFVRENNLPRVDFIKADVEGFERNMLAGAQETLRNFEPKLALSTYHLPDDHQVMAELILKANPKYNIVQKRRKLFASVPK